MSERITISLKDSELLEIENLAKSEGSTVRDIINRRIRESKRVDEIESRMIQTNEKIEDLNNSISDLKNSNIEMFNLIKNLKISLANSLKIISYQTSFSKDFSNLSLEQVVPEGQKIETYRASIENRSSEFSEKIFNEFFK